MDLYGSEFDPLVDAGPDLQLETPPARPADGAAPQPSAAAKAHLAALVAELGPGIINPTFGRAETPPVAPVAAPAPAPTGPLYQYQQAPQADEGFEDPNITRHKAAADSAAIYMAGQQVSQHLDHKMEGQPEAVKKLARQLASQSDPRAIANHEALDGIVDWAIGNATRKGLLKSAPLPSSETATPAPTSKQNPRIQKMMDEFNSNCKNKALHVTYAEMETAVREG